MDCRDSLNMPCNLKEFREKKPLDYQRSHEYLTTFLSQNGLSEEQAFLIAINIGEKEIYVIGDES